jgi:hypothetical protein
MSGSRRGYLGLDPSAPLTVDAREVAMVSRAATFARR